VVICLERGADLHMAQLMPLPLTVSCFSKIQIGFTFLLSAHPGSPGQRAEENGCVCVCPLVTQPKASKHYTHLGSMGKTIYIYIFADIFSSFLTSQKNVHLFCFFSNTSVRISLFIYNFVARIRWNFAYLKVNLADSVITGYIRCIQCLREAMET